MNHDPLRKRPDFQKIKVCFVLGFAGGMHYGKDYDGPTLKGEVRFVQTSTWLCGHYLSVIRPGLSSSCETLSARGLAHVFHVADVSAGARHAGLTFDNLRFRISINNYSLTASERDKQRTLRRPSMVDFHDRWESLLAIEFITWVVGSLMSAALTRLSKPANTTTSMYKQ